jgi:hypothetical protein
VFQSVIRVTSIQTKLMIEKATSQLHTFWVIVSNDYTTEKTWVIITETLTTELAATYDVIIDEKALDWKNLRLLKQFVIDDVSW